MKGIFKLTAGEIKKLAKSYTLAIMSSILALVIGLFALIYATTDLSKGDGGLSTIVSLIQGDEVVDAFDVFDTALDSITKGGEIEIGGSSSGVDSEELKPFLERFTDARKVSMLKEDPFRAAVSINPATMVINANPAIIEDFTAGNHTLYLLLTETYIYKLIEGALVLKQIDLFTQPAAVSTITAADIGMVFDAMVNSLDSSSVRQDFFEDKTAAVNLVLECFAEFGKAVALEDYLFAGIYNAVILPSGIHGTIRDMYKSGVMGADNQIKRLESDIKYFEDNNFEKGYIDIIKDMFVELADRWVLFRDAVKEFPNDGSNQKYDEMLSKYYDFRWHLGEVQYYCEYSFMTPKFLLYKLKGTSVDENLRKIDNFLNSLRSPNRTVVSAYNDQESAENKIKNIIKAVPDTEEYINSLSTKYLSDQKNLMYSQFMQVVIQLEGSGDLKDIDGKPFGKLSPNYTGADTTEGRLKEYMDALDAGYKAAFGKDRYDRVVKDSFARLGDIKAIGVRLEENDGTAEGDYAKLRADYKKYTNLQKELTKLVTASSQLEVFSEMKFKDSDVKAIIGFQLFTSKYSLERDVSRATFVIENMDDDEVYGATLGLTKGYGFMEFAFVIISMLVLIYGIIIGAGTIAGEHSDGTMKLLLIRPYTRAQILLAKTLATLFVVLVMLAASFLFTFVIGGIGWGFESMKVLAIFNATTPLIFNSLSILAIEYVTMFLEIIVYVFIAITISTVFKSRAGATAIAIFIYFLTYVLNAILSSYSWYRFVIFNNTNLFMYFSTGPTLNDMTFLFSLAIDLLYLGAFVLLSFFTFVKRDAT